MAIIQWCVLRFVNGKWCAVLEDARSSFLSCFFLSTMLMPVPALNESDQVLVDILVYLSLIVVGSPPHQKPQARNLSSLVLQKITARHGHHCWLVLPVGGWMDALSSAT